ncbi:hypothetical protein XA68_10388 [Ophiocordyceps unilateralis]|uniref:Uncharacterized protein n=1 Tax=Ophiocordyceps unilateralis TaxID=268505 RepID=A0A2A9P2V3_OPHUN|nr:hypothetical protein XA68_10388 [Ophiocordyceps unilateralis]
MDPTTTLITFLLQTDPSIQSVNLIGSWDGFSTCYPMKPDVRRGRGQWRGCYSFKDIICDDEAAVTRRDGGLKMGATYYYYYEVDGSVETFDPVEPSTTACPYLPGQTVNTLSVPVERSERHRSASLNSLHADRFKTMDPDAKFATPCPPAAPPATEAAASRRLASAPGLHRARMPAPPASWKRLFSRKLSGRGPDDGAGSSPTDAGGSIAPPVASRARDISPESLRRFLSNDGACRLEPARPHPGLVIPEDIVEEADDDDYDYDDDDNDNDNFATSPLPEKQLYATSLSPPPIRRYPSSDAMANASSLTLKAAPPPSVPPAASLPRVEASSRPMCWSISATSSGLTWQSVEDDPPSFYDSYDEDDVMSSNDGDNFSHAPLPSLSSSAERAFKVYSLPRQADEVKGDSIASPRSPRLLARSDSTGGAANLLGADTGLDDLVSELGWMVDVIGNK